MTGNVTMVYFLRHGETTGNLTNIFQGQLDYPLSALGLRQGELAGERLRGMEFDIIYSSDLDRARITAEKAACGREVFLIPELREWDLGRWQGKTIEEIRKEFPQEYQTFRDGDPDFVPSGGESMEDIRLRASDVLDKLYHRHTGKKILCVSHSGFIIQILKRSIGVKSFAATPKCSNASLCCFASADGKKWQMLLWNDCSHLA